MSIVDAPNASAGQAGSTTKGQATLVSGTIAVNIPGMTASSIVVASPQTPTGTVGVGYKCVCTTNTLTITAYVTGLGTQVLDNSVLNYIAVL